MLCGRSPSPGPIRVDRPGGETTLIRTEVHADPTSVRESVDMVILAVKAHQVESAAGWLRALCSRSTTLAVFQNGVEHVESVRPHVAEGTIVPVIVHCTAEVVQAGWVVAKTPMRLQVAAGADGARLAEKFSGSGVTVEAVDDFMTAQWRKLCLNAVAGLMAATGRPAEIYRLGEMADLACRLARECIEVGRAEGAQLEDALAEQLVAQFRLAPPESGTSMLTDRLASRPLEWEARNGVIRRLGRKHGVPTPVSDVLVPLLASASRC